MDNSIPILILLAFPLFFITLWVVIAWSLKKASGMGKEITDERGLRLEQSSWGTAVINGVNASNCARVAKYELGYQIEMMKIFGGGKLWLPAEAISIESETPRRFLFPEKKVIRSENNKIVLWGRLCKTIRN